MLGGIGALAALLVAALVLRPATRPEPAQDVDAAAAPEAGQAPDEAAAATPETPAPAAVLPAGQPVAPAAKTGGAAATPRPPVPAAVATAPPAAAPAPEPAAEAVTRLNVAREKLRSNLVDQGVADLRSIVSDYPTSRVAADASYLAAETLTSLGRADDAMAAHLEFASRFAGDARFAASQLALAELTLKSRQPNRDDAARAIFGRAAAADPGSPTALRALQAKVGIEDRRRLKERDATTGREVPATLATLRMLAEQFPDSPHAMLALYRLGSGYADTDQWEMAAHAWTDLATRFPANPNDAWWLLGELYERRLRDDARAKAAYAQVPPSSRRYQDAQRRAGRR
jgi:TolA-binding protein